MTKSPFQFEIAVEPLFSMLPFILRPSAPVFAILISLLFEIYELPSRVIPEPLCTISSLPFVFLITAFVAMWPLRFVIFILPLFSIKPSMSAPFSEPLTMVKVPFLFAIVEFSSILKASEPLFEMLKLPFVFKISAS